MVAGGIDTQVTGVTGVVVADTFILVVVIVTGIVVVGGIGIGGTAAIGIVAPW